MIESQYLAAIPFGLKICEDTGAETLQAPVCAGEAAVSTQHQAASTEADSEVLAALRGTRRRAAQLKSARDKLLVEVTAPTHLFCLQIADASRSYPSLSTGKVEATKV